MRDDVKNFVALCARTFPIADPVVDIGSLQTPGQEGYANLRSLFSGATYIGCDVVAGPGVDRIEDVHRLNFADDSVGTLVIVETLEHVANPYRAIREVQRVLRPGGIAVVTTPFNFPVHHMPDFMRFTPEGMARLLGVFGAAAVFSQGDAQNPHTVYAVALKSADRAAQLAFEAAATRLQSEWYMGGYSAPLLRFMAVDSAVRWDRPERGLAAGRGVEQRFTCPRGGLTRIDVRCSRSGSGSSGWLRLRLEDSSGAAVAVVETRELYVEPETWIAFPFAPLPASAGERFAFRIESSDPESTVTVCASERTTLADSELAAAGAALSGTACFEAFCQRPAETGVTLAEADATEVAAAKAGDVVAEAARLQGQELYHVATLLREAIEQLRIDVVDRVNHLGDELIKVELRQQSHADQLIKLELRQQAQTDQLIAIELRQQTQTDQLVTMETREQRHEAMLRGVAAQVADVGSYISALRQNRLLLWLSRLLSFGRAPRA